MNLLGLTTAKSTTSIILQTDEVLFSYRLLTSFVIPHPFHVNAS